MQVEFINPFVTATCNVFRTMLQCELVRGRLALKRSHTPTHEISGLISLTGKYHGIVALSLGRETAIQATEILLGYRPSELHGAVTDAIGEVTNMIVGPAKAQLEEYQLRIGLPKVICGKHHLVSFPMNSVPFLVPFESEIGPVCLEVGLGLTPGVSAEMSLANCR
jgi:chemotaxis protein CheX